VLRWIDGAPLRTLDTLNAPMLDHLALLLRRVQRGADVAPTYDPCAAQLARAEGEVAGHLQKLEDALAKEAVGLVPCHGDFHPLNVIDTGDKVWLIDWPGLCMAEPLWDMAYFARCLEMDNTPLRQFLYAYSPNATSADLIRLKMWCSVADIALYHWYVDFIDNGGETDEFTCRMPLFLERFMRNTAHMPKG
jgi:thiamine kinase-like enzyme